MWSLQSWTTDKQPARHVLLLQLQQLLNKHYKNTVNFRVWIMYGPSVCKTSTNGKLLSETHSNDYAACLSLENTSSHPPSPYCSGKDSLVMSQRRKRDWRSRASEQSVREGNKITATTSILNRLFFWNVSTYNNPTNRGPVWGVSSVASTRYIAQLCYHRHISNTKDTQAGDRQRVHATHRFLPTGSVPSRCALKDCRYNSWLYYCSNWRLNKKPSGRTHASLHLNKVVTELSIRMSRKQAGSAT